MLIFILFHLYLPICDRWFVFDNMDLVPEIIAQGHEFGESIVYNELWSRLKAEYNG